MTSVKQAQRISRLNNFDLLRFVFAFLVFIHHACVLSSTQEMKVIHLFINPLSSLAVPSFFIISGFLIFMSYENSHSLKNYFEKRFSRILPAYCFVVVLCAFGGCFFSTLPWNQYFGRKLLEFLLFNLTFLNFVQPSLPGVFENNPLMSSVNGSLWTIKIELSFYVAVPLLVLLLRRYNKLITITAIYILSFIYGELFNLIGEQTGRGVWFELAKQLPGQLTFFISGALLYYYFDIFQIYFKPLLIVSTIVLIVSYHWEISATESYSFSFVTPICLAIIIISIVFFTFYTDLFSKHGDLSYGIYIYHFPLVQILVSYGLFESSPYLTLMLSSLAVISISYASWHFLEKPFLRRGHISSHKKSRET